MVTQATLSDGGANGGLLVSDVRILEHVPNSCVSITGVAGNVRTEQYNSVSLG